MNHTRCPRNWYGNVSTTEKSPVDYASKMMKLFHISCLNESYQASSKLVWECLQTLQTLAAHNSIALCWVPGHRGIVGNEKADALAKRGVGTPYFGLESVCGISMRTAKTTVKIMDLGKTLQPQWLKYPDHKYNVWLGN